MENSPEVPNEGGAQSSVDAATTAVEQSKWPPLRRPHLKSRGGCTTCKARRVKCDEQKPACGTCTKAKRECGGYEEVKPRRPPQRSELTIVEFKKPNKAVPPSHNRGVSTITFANNPVRGVPAPLTEHTGSLAKDLRALQYFRERLLPPMHSLFPLELWEKGIVAIAEKVEGIRHLVISIADYHESIDWTDKNHPWQTDIHPVAAARGQKESMFALKHYTAALARIRECIDNGAPAMIVKIATFLFAMLEFLRGQRMAAMEHFATGIRLVLQRPNTNRAKKSPSSFGIPGKSSPIQQMKALARLPQDITKLVQEDQSLMDRSERDVNVTISKLSLIQGFYYRPGGPGKPPPLAASEDETVGEQSPLTSDIRSNSGSSSATPDPPAILEFEDVNEARDSICRIMAHVARLRGQQLQESSIDGKDSIYSRRAGLEQKLHDWSIALTSLENNQARANNGKSPIHAPCQFLRAHYLLTTIFLRTSNIKNQIEFDAHLGTFRNIVDTLEIVLRDPDAMAQITEISILDTGVTAPLFYTATKCRDTTVRQRAIKLIKETPRMCRLWWNGYETAKAAELVADFEEKEALERRSFSLEQGDDDPRPEMLQHIIPEAARVQELEILERDPTDTSSQVVVIHWKPGGIDSEIETTSRLIDWTLT